MKRAVENSEEFLGMLSEWQIIEDESIANAHDILNKTRHPVIKMTMELIKHDSERHKLILQMVRETIEKMELIRRDSERHSFVLRMLDDKLRKEPLTLPPEELEAISRLLITHSDTEAKALAFADKAYHKSELFITKYLLSILLADETKHNDLLGKLHKLSGASAVFGFQGTSREAAV